MSCTPRSCLHRCVFDTVPWNKCRMTFWTLPVFAMMCALSPDIQRSVSIRHLFGCDHRCAHKCHGAWATHRRSLSVPCSQLEVSRRIHDLTRGRLECQRILVPQLLARSANSRKHRSCTSSVHSDSQPTRHLILSRVMERDRSTHLPLSCTGLVCSSSNPDSANVVASLR